MGEQVITTFNILHNDIHSTILASPSYAIPVVPAYQMPYPYPTFPSRSTKEFGVDYSDPRVYSTVPPSYTTVPHAYEHGFKENKDENEQEDGNNDENVSDSNEDENSVEVEEVVEAVKLGKKTCNVKWSCKLGEFILLLTIN